MNPIFDRKYFIADPEAHKMPDGRLYVYGSTDIGGASKWSCPRHEIFSTDDPKLEKWTYHGISFLNTVENPQVSWKPGADLYAPDAIHKNGKYYLYFCGGDGGFEGVAVADAPYGPFKNAVPINCANGDGIDPAVFVDDDGTGYLLWGQFSLRGAKLNDDMLSIDESTLNPSILTEREHGFHEGASLRKRNGKYYIVYTDISRGGANCISYAMADAPLGPYKKKGTIIDNVYCGKGSWNDHGSIEEYCGQWYVFYHRSSQDDKFSRRTCVEKIFFNEDGTIDEVEMTSQGASDPIKVFQKIDASIACRMKNCRVGPDENGLNGEVLTSHGNGSWGGDWAEYKYLDFEDGASKVTVCAKGKGLIKICTEHGKLLTEIPVDSETFETYTSDIKNQTGVKPMWLVFVGVVSVSCFEFE